MFSVPHLVIIFIVVLVVFGPHRLPELARGLGKMMAEFRKASTDFKLAFEEEMRTIERQAREVEFKKSQEAAAAGGAEQQAATLGTPAGADTPKILPENSSAMEPVITPITESVSREAHSSEPSNSAAAISPGELPVSEGTPASPEASQADGAQPLPQPPNDQRQSA